MDLANDLDICKKTEISILSDTKLTDEQMQHIDNCESCKALLSQINSMKNDLHKFSVPGIKKGQIADSVMASIKQQKTSVPFPKFKVTHHLGTAAAVAIILVATLVISKPFTNPVSSGNSTSQKTVTNEAAPESEVHMLSKGLAPDTDEGQVQGLYFASPKNFNSDEYDSVEFTTDSASAGGQTPQALNDVLERVQDHGFAQAESKESVFFSGIEFGSNLEENIELANAYIFETKGIPDYFNSADYNSNQEFLAAFEKLQL